MSVWLAGLTGYVKKSRAWKIPSTSSFYQPGLLYLTVAVCLLSVILYLTDLRLICVKLLETSEGLHALTALAFYTRLRITQLLLPLLKRSTSLSRVINIAGGTKEGTLYPSDMQALTTPLYAIRGHLTTLITLGHEALAARAPGVSFLQVFPGAVQTALFDRMPAPVGLVMRCFIALAGRWVLVPVQESGERNVFLATSAAFPGRDDGGERDRIGLVEGLSVAKGVDGKPGSGVYSLDYDGAEAGQGVMDLLEGYRKEGMVERVWEHAQAEFERITEEDSHRR